MTRVLALFLIGALACLYTAGRGFMALDQSIVFDGGWRILSGQIPFRDFSLLTGAVPSLLQALFFKSGGLSWLVYAAHAALFNGLFCVLAYALMRNLDTPRPIAFFLALLTALSYYAPFGTPYMEQHAFFFVLSAIWLLIRSRRSDSSRLRFALRAAVPLVFALAVFSKQNVAAFAVPALFIACGISLRNRSDIPQFIAALLFGVTLTVAAGIAISVHWQIDLAAVYDDLVVVAAEIGYGRLTRLNMGALLWLLGLASIWVMLIGTLHATMTLVRASGPDQPERRGSLLLRPAGNIGLALALVGLSVLFVATTENQGQNGVPYLFLSLGLFFRGILDLIAIHPKVLSKPLGPVLQSCVIAAACADGFAYFRSDALREVHDMSFSQARSNTPTSPGLGFLQLQDDIRPTAAEIDALLALLRGSNRNFFLLSDVSILYGLTGRPSVNPYLWFRAGMKSETFLAERRSDYEQRLIANLQRFDVGLIVIDSAGTRMDLRLEDLPLVQSYLEGRVIRRYLLANHEIWELGS